MTPLQEILNTYRQQAKTEREKGTYFEYLVKAYLLNEPSYKDLFNGKVFLWEEWRRYWMEQGNSDPGIDAGIDLVALEDVEDSPRIFAIQAKFYDEDARLRKSDGIDSFLSALGKSPYTNGILFLTTTQASTHVVELMKGRDKSVNIVALSDLEASQIDWSQYQPDTTPVLRDQKALRPHQVTAVNAVKAGLLEDERGKLIMACGTGKTFTSLKIAEELAGKGGRVLFLVPSLSLLSQTLTEWTQESQTPLHSFAVCSDSDVGKKKRDNDDDVKVYIHELRYPATTKPRTLANEFIKRHDNQHMSVVYSTYHSIEVISEAQKQFGLEPFDLIICDEAHRTTGSKWAGEDESHFVKVHDGDFIRSTKRLYMTATPRIYGDSAKIKQESGDVALFSMDDERLYGKELFVINFSEAVSRGLLCDYKVIVLTVSAEHISHRLQGLLSSGTNSLKVDDAGRIVGSWKALAKLGLEEDIDSDLSPMRRAVAFCQVIEAQNRGTKHKVSSKQISGMFQQVVEAYQKAELKEGRDHGTLICEAEHIDGSMNASQKEQKINWLKEKTPENTCRILSNVRCLSEGVDVPALDAVLFLTPRNSQVDVVQSVGRVMRNASGKQRGYVILPVVIPEGVEPHEALNDNQTYRVVWEVLQALRSHDDRFDAHINKLDLIGKNPHKMEVISITDDVQKKRDTKPKSKTPSGQGSYAISEQPAEYKPKQEPLQFNVGELERALYAKVVKKCGNRNHWAEWANDIAKIANTHITRIRTIVSDERNTKEVAAFKGFADELRDDLNDSITDEEVIEMLAQHLITKPVFDALFESYSFASNNPVSQAMQQVLDVLQEHRLDKEADTLEQFYESVKMRAEGVNNAEGKQKIVVELYDKFFHNAFPRMTERLGIVYTPVEVVDFIIHSINDLLQQEFGQTIGSEGVHILDPFTGTGTFITRLLQSGLISKEQLPYKYQHEIHANEIVLLAYYIAAINIEATYHALLNEGVEVGQHQYQLFEGICLTDTFQMYEKDDLISELLADNSDRRIRQKELDIRVIMGNPPYSSGQRDAADNAENMVYPMLDARITDTYIRSSIRSDGKSKAYDSYIRAIRWASDRVGESGIVGFVTNAGFLEANTADGLRKCLAEEFSSIYVFHLRGNQRTQGELSRKEGGKIFGSGSRAPIAITLLVKNPQAKNHDNIYWHDIGDYLTREQKLEKIGGFVSVEGIAQADGWQTIVPDDHGDWLSQRDDTFNQFINVGDKKDRNSITLFQTYSMGVKTNRDDWVFSSSFQKLSSRTERMVGFYNSEVVRYLTDKGNSKSVVDFVSDDKSKIKWTSDLLNDVEKGKEYVFERDDICPALRRPFFKQYLYKNKAFNWTRHLMDSFFPTPAIDNKSIYITGTGTAKEFTVMMTDTLPDFQLLANGQALPLYLYEKAGDDTIDFGDTSDLFAEKAACEKGYTRKDGITDEGLHHFQEAYPGEQLAKEDIFYYVYGLLHSPDYRERYADNLSKELPRIPCVKTAKDFWHFSNAGRELADLHINYETVEPYSATLDIGKRKLAELEAKDFYVTKMKHPKVKNDEGKSVNDLSTVIYNHAITVGEIPVEAYDYVVNGKPAIEWVVERQCVKTDKDSGIVNDANDWAIETMKNPKYPLELLLRVITVSLETNRVVIGLPKLDI
ncbi:DEAD/DEAH box helicase [Porticoccus sp.]|uniref:DEAD/DEAH box helicase n=1 Tax=Porticoccus sp. TaxID=2024853 RepID=UPI0039E4C709